MGGGWKKVCVSEWERDREREREIEGKIGPSSTRQQTLLWDIKLVKNRCDPNRTLSLSSAFTQSPQVCGSPLSCGNHTCEAVCHDGMCPPCPRSISRSCPCGKNSEDTHTHTTWHGSVSLSAAVKMSLCNTVCVCMCTESSLPCTEEVLVCGDTCDRRLVCGKHTCSMRCHRGSCETCRQVSLSPTRSLGHSHTHTQKHWRSLCVRWWKRSADVVNTGSWCHVIRNVCVTPSVQKPEAARDTSAGGRSVAIIIFIFSSQTSEMIDSSQCSVFSMF